MTKDFAARLTGALAARGMNQGGLAAAVGVTPAAVSNWVRGQVPRPARLVEVATALGVSVDYLTSGSGELPLDVEALRESYREQLRVYARPVPFDGGREFGNTAEHAFELNLRILAREVGQNSGDEEVEGGDGVDMAFTVIELTGEEFDAFTTAPWWEQYRQHLEAASAEGNSKASRQIKQSLQRLDSDRRLVLLRVDDYGANGLTGAEYARGRFTAVMRNQLDSQKDSSGGGSFGLGKNAMWGCSEFSVVLANSRLSVPEDGKIDDRFFGRGQLPAHTIGEQDYAGPIWIGRPDSGRPNPVAGMPPTVRSIFENPVLVDDLHLKRTDRRPGSSFLVVGFFDPSGAATTTEAMAKELAESVAANFWAAMTPSPDQDAKLRVQVEVQKNRAVTSTSTVVNSGMKPGFVKAYEKHLSGETVDSVDQLEHVDDVLSIHIPLSIPKRLSEIPHEEKVHDATLLVRLADPDEGDVNKIVWLRGSRMTITEERITALPVGAAPFHAVILVGRAAGDDVASGHAESFLRSGEPPQHDKWIATADLTTSYARGAKKKLADFQSAVREAVRKAVARPSAGTSDGPADLKNLLRIGAPPTSTESRPRVKTASGRPDADGSWPIEVTVALPVAKRKRLKEWRLTPVVRFAAYSGSGAAVKWRSLEPVKNCQIENGQLVAEIGTRTLKFRGVTDPHSHPVQANLAKAVVDVRVQEEASR